VETTKAIRGRLKAPDAKVKIPFRAVEGEEEEGRREITIIKRR
jgi:hypothetical protein